MESIYGAVKADINTLEEGRAEKKWGQVPDRLQTNHSMTRRRVSRIETKHRSNMCKENGLTRESKGDA
jgi:hypothetical protein